MRTLLGFALVLMTTAVYGAAPLVRNDFSTNSIPGYVNSHNFGTIAAAGTATIASNTNLYRAVFSGSTFNIDLPATPPIGGFIEFQGTNTVGGTQVGTIKVAGITTSLVREELAVNGVPTLVSTLTNAIGGAFTYRFYSTAGVWTRVAASGDLLSFTTHFKNYLKFNFPRIVFGGCIYANTNDYTANTFMVPRFSATLATNNNYCRFAVGVPTDMDTTVDPRATLKVRLTGTDTAAQIYNVGLLSVPDSSVDTAAAGTWIKLDIAADGAGAINKVESVRNVTLTGWAAALTPQNWWIIELNRAGDTDASTLATDLLELEIEYQITQ